MAQLCDTILQSSYPDCIRIRMANLMEVNEKPKLNLSSTTALFTKPPAP